MHEEGGTGHIAALQAAQLLDMSNLSICPLSMSVYCVQTNANSPIVTHYQDLVGASF